MLNAGSLIRKKPGALFKTFERSENYCYGKYHLINCHFGVKFEDNNT